MQEAILKAAELSFAYGEKEIIDNVSFSIPKGQYIALIGPNGSGKTTLLNILAGRFKPKRGNVFYQGVSLAKMSIQEKAKHFAVIHQNESSQFPFTVLEMVLMGQHPYRSRFSRITAADLALAREIMTATDTLKLAEKSVIAISGGEFQRVILARALMQQPKILFMDEAMADLDISARIKIIKLLKDFVAEKQMTIVAIDHDLVMAYRFSDYILALKEGRLWKEGSPHEVFNEQFLADVFNVKAKIIDETKLFIEDNIS